MSAMKLPTDPIELAVVVLIVAGAPFFLWFAIKHLLSGFLPPERIKIPKAGKLEKILSPHLKSFVASLPRPAGDPLAAICQPIASGTLPYFDNHGYVNALYPLWKSGPRYSLAVRSWAKRKKERTEFVWCGEKPEDEWGSRALSEQGFLADTLIEVMKTLDWSNRPQALGPAQRASDALGFRYFDETVKWFTLKERTDDDRFDFISGIDARESG